MIRRPPRSTQSRSSAASDVYKRQVDDLLPHSRADVFLYCQLHDTRRAWASMLEKASARRFNGFSCLDGGRSQEAFEMLMGAVGTMLSYKPDDPDVVSGKVWNTILSYYSRGFPMACSSMSGSDATTNSMNIVQGHACLLYTSPSPRDRTRSRMPSSA
eukprot:TRINITY_DN9438_c0_g1_i1.p1 TRINITY_DN9438_c0_g1~~TRINITY_DN9438_c0_g1_i1.p1  ORF type:complete len:158 (+),score=54.05 TRINITY_DN9438_c0_g1_i1:118-591(+)